MALRERKETASTVYSYTHVLGESKEAARTSIPIGFALIPMSHSPFVASYATDSPYIGQRRNSILSLLS